MAKYIAPADYATVCIYMWRGKHTLKIDLMQFIINLYGLHQSEHWKAIAISSVFFSSCVTLKNFQNSGKHQDLLMYILHIK